MPYCAKCNYRTRKPPPANTGVACVNCGEPPNELDARLSAPEAGVALSMAIGVALAFCGIICIGGKFPSIGVSLILTGLGSLLWGIIRQEKLDAANRTASQVPFPDSVFSEIRQNRQTLARHAQEIRDVLVAEATEAGSERAVHRQELLRGALANRDAQIRLLDADLWTREVQLWLNQLEGFLASKLPKLGRDNAAQLCDTFAALVEAGAALQAQSAELDLDGIMPQRALRVLQDCLATAPELEDRVKDARALAVVGEGPEQDPNFAPGGSWLHWLQEAIPTIELQPSEFTEDEEYLRVQTELRLLRDGVKYGDARSLDRPADSLDRGSFDGDRERE